MSFRTTVTLSVAVVFLSIIAHQSDSRIIPGLLKQVMDVAYKAAKLVNYYYQTAMSYVSAYVGLDIVEEEPKTGTTYKDGKVPANKKKKPERKQNNKDGILLTKEELKQYTGEENSPGVYVGILGSVFDVGTGRQHYGPGGGYHFFAGVDGTRAFVTGEFNEAGLIDDVSGLKPSELKSLSDWLEFYKKDYKYVGKVIGNFYDSKGKATQELRNLLKSVRKHEADLAEIEKEKNVLPPCNVEWNKEQGYRVWCTIRSGGVKRDSAGVPRRLVTAGAEGQKSRCVCVEPKAAVSDARLGEYEGCPPGADSCWVSEL